MRTRICIAAVAVVVITANVQADIPHPGPRPPRPPRFVDVPPPPAPPKAVKLTLTRDHYATTGRVILPSTVTASLSPIESPRAASMPMVGLAIVGALIACGLWLARVSSARKLAAVAIPLLALVFVSAGVYAQAVRLEAPRDVLEKGKIIITRADAGEGLVIYLPMKSSR